MLAFAEADAHDSTRADGDQSLGDLIADGRAIRPRIDEAQEPLQTERRTHDEVIEHRQRREADERESPQAQAGHEDHGADDDLDDERGAEVGLGQDQEHRQLSHGDWNEQALAISGCLFVASRQHRGQHHDHSHLGELGGLEPSAAEGQPAPRSTREVTDSRD